MVFVQFSPGWVEAWLRQTEVQTSQAENEKKKLLLNAAKGHSRDKNSTCEEEKQELARTDGEKSKCSKTSFCVATRDAPIWCQYWVSVSIPGVSTGFFNFVLQRNLGRFLDKLI